LTEEKTSTEADTLESGFDDWLKKIEEPYKDTKITVDKFVDESPAMSKFLKTKQAKIMYFLVIISVFLLQSLSKVIVPILEGKVPITFELLFLVGILVFGVLGYSLGGRLLYIFDMYTLRKNLNVANIIFHMQVEKRKEERKDWEWRRKKELELDSHIKDERKKKEKFDNALTLRGDIYQDLILKAVGSDSPPPEISPSFLNAAERMDANLFINSNEAMQNFQVQEILNNIERQSHEHSELSRKNRESLLKMNELNTKLLLEIKDLWKEINTTKMLLQQHDILPTVNLTGE
jgi:hypothetical protein